MQLLLDSLVLFGGATLLAKVCPHLRVPPLLGMIAVGILWRTTLGSGETPPPALLDIATPLRLAVLTLVLLRAGLGISMVDLRQAGPLAIGLGIVPNLCEASAVAVLSVLLLDLNIITAAMLGCLVAAISPAIVIPNILQILQYKHPDRTQPHLYGLLVGAPLDNIFSLLCLSVLLELAGSSDAGMAGAIAQLPIAWLAGAAVGIAGAWGIGFVLKRAGSQSAQTEAMITAGVALGVVALCELSGMSMVIATLSLGMTLNHRAPLLAKNLSVTFASWWPAASIVLFALIGAAVDVGPIAHAGFWLVTIVVLGQLGRAAGVALATANTELNRTDKLVCAVAYIPKATIQAAFAGLPLDRGLAGGELIVTTCVIAIVLTVPIGVLAYDTWLIRAVGTNSTGDITTKDSA